MGRGGGGVEQMKLQQTGHVPGLKLIVEALIVKFQKTRRLMAQQRRRITIQGKSCTKRTRKENHSGNPLQAKQYAIRIGEILYQINNGREGLGKVQD